MTTREKTLERLRRLKRRKQKIIRAIVHLFVWIGAAVLYYIGFSIFFDTPYEYAMKHSTDGLQREYDRLTARYDSLMHVVDNVKARDRHVFRTLFESEPYDFDSEFETGGNLRKYRQPFVAATPQRAGSRHLVFGKTACPPERQL